MKKYSEIKQYESHYLEYLSDRGLAGEYEASNSLHRVADFAELVVFVRENHIANYSRLIDHLIAERPELLDTAVNQYPEQIMKYIENNY